MDGLAGSHKAKQSKGAQRRRIDREVSPCVKMDGQDSAEIIYPVVGQNLPTRRTLRQHVKVYTPRQTHRSNIMIILRKLRSSFGSPLIRTPMCFGYLDACNK